MWFTVLSQPTSFIIILGVIGAQESGFDMFVRRTVQVAVEGEGWLR